MIFTEKTATAIDTGRKVQHRVPTGRKWRTGQRITIQPGAGEPPVCHVQITSIDHAQPLTITRQQARLEGFDGVRGVLNYKRSWLERHDKAWATRHQHTETGLTDELVAQRFDTQTYVVDVLTFELADDAPHFLAQPGPYQGDYTTQRHRAIDDLEVIDKATQDRYAKDALAFCLGRQLKRQRDHAEARARKKIDRHPAPWWENAA